MQGAMWKLSHHMFFGRLRARQHCGLCCTLIPRLRCECLLPASQPSTALLVNWDKRTYVNLQAEKKKAKADADVEVRAAPLL